MSHRCALQGQPKGHVFDIMLVKDGGSIAVTVDGNLAVEWTDSDPFGPGYVGLRQMVNTVKNYYHWFDVYAK